jgi:hypothetical protein
MDTAQMKNGCDLLFFFRFPFPLRRTVVPRRWFKLSKMMSFRGRINFESGIRRRIEVQASTEGKGTVRNSAGEVDIYPDC